MKHMKTTTRHTDRNETRAASYARTAADLKGELMSKEEIETLRKDIKKTAW